MSNQYHKLRRSEGSASAETPPVTTVGGANTEPAGGAPVAAWGTAWGWDVTSDGPVGTSAGGLIRRLPTPTAVVARKLERHFLGIEIDEYYACLALKRIKLAEADRSIQPRVP